MTRTGRRKAWLAIVLIVASSAAALAFWSARERSSRETVTLAVLPFKPLTLDDRNESLELGMAETLIAVLNSGRLSVSPLSSVRRFAGADQDVLEAGRALEVQSVLEGHIQRAGNRLRISARLLDVADGRQLWAQRYDESFTDIFSVQDTIAAKVRAALTAELDPATPAALRRHTRDSEAYQLFANGRFHLLRLDTRQAITWFHAAIERDPNFALAYVGLAEAYSMLGVFGTVAPGDAFPQARRAVDAALQLAPDLGEAHASLGHIKMQYEGDRRGAKDAYRRAIELSPTYARSYQWYGLLLAVEGRFEEGIEQLQRARELEPSQPIYSALIGMVLMYQRRNDEAIKQLLLTLQMDPAFATTNAYLAAAYVRSGQFAEARARLHQLRGPAPGIAACLGQIYALSGQRDLAVQEIEKLRVLSAQRYVSAYDIATIYAALQDVEATFEWLKRAVEERSQLHVWLRWDPLFDFLHEDPRYTALVAQLE